MSQTAGSGLPVTCADAVVSPPRVVAVVGSPRPAGNSSFVVDVALEEMSLLAISVEKLLLGDFQIGPCLGHDDCGDRPVCPINDEASAVVAKVYDADGVVLASPVYGDNVSGQMKVFMDRCCHNYNHERRLNARVAGLIAVGESTGLTETIAAMERFLSQQRATHIPSFTAVGYASRLGDARKNDADRKSVV